jgi:hypothetical protein
VLISITNESDLLTKHPSGSGVALSAGKERTQLKYLETQSSYETPDGFSSFENSSAPYTVCSSGNAKQIENNKNNVTKIQVNPLHFLIVQRILLTFMDLISLNQCCYYYFR